MTTPEPTAERSPQSSAQPFLDTEPPHWAMTGIAWVLLVVVALAVVAAVLIRLPETVAAPFVLESRQASDPLRALHLGTVRQIGAHEGAPVARGQVLFVVESEQVGDRSSELAEAEVRLRGAHETESSRRDRLDQQAHVDDEEKRRLLAHVRHSGRAHEIEKEQLALLQEVAERYEKLHKRGQVDTVTFRGHQLSVQRSRLAVEQAQAALDEARLVLAKHDFESAMRGLTLLEQSRAASDDAEALQRRITMLSQELKHSSDNRTEVHAPCDGELVRLAVRAVGTIVEEGETLGEVHCRDGGLQARLTLPEVAVGRIRPGQRVKLMCDAFPYQRFGVREGQTRWVSPRTVGDGDGASFQALVDVDTTSFEVDGQERSLRAGMGGVAQIVLGRRSLLSFVFEPLRQLREQMDVGATEGASSTSGDTTKAP